MAIRLHFVYVNCVKLDYGVLMEVPSLRIGSKMARIAPAEQILDTEPVKTLSRIAESDIDR
jgi:hypothetical protein